MGGRSRRVGNDLGRGAKPVKLKSPWRVLVLEERKERAAAIAEALDAVGCETRTDSDLEKVFELARELRPEVMITNRGFRRGLGPLIVSHSRERLVPDAHFIEYAGRDACAAISEDVGPRTRCLVDPWPDVACTLFGQPIEPLETILVVAVPATARLVRAARDASPLLERLRREAPAGENVLRSLAEAKGEAERFACLRALDSQCWNITAAARELHTSRQHVQKLMKKHDITPPIGARPRHLLPTGHS